MTRKGGEERRTARRFGWTPWVLLAAAWFATMPFRPLLDPDEGRYSEIPREMAATGDWVTPRLNGLKYFEKPPLQYWATAAAYSVFGVSEWTARLWTVGLGFLCLPMVFAWTSRLFGRNAGVAAVMALAASPYFELLAHLNLLDAGFAFWVSGTVFAFTLAQCAAVGSSAERRWMLVAWTSAALAVLTKGIVVGVLAGGTLICYTLIERDVRPWKRLHAATGVPLFLAVAAPWFVWVSMRNPSFPQFFFVHEHFARFLTTVHQRTEPWWYFGALFIVAVLPWIGAVPGACRGAWRTGRAPINLDTASDNIFKPLKFLLIFSAITVVFFSLSGSKLAPYILPMVPPLAAVMGAQVARSPRFLRRVAQFTSALLIVLIAGFVLYSDHRLGFLPRTAEPWLAAVAAAAVCGAVAAWRAAPGREDGVWVAAATAMLGWQFLMSAYAELPERSAFRMLRTVEPLIHPETELFSIGQYRETISPYLGRTLTLVQFEGELAFGLAEEPSLGLGKEAFLDRWNAATHAVVFVSPEVFTEWHREGMPGKVIGGDGVTLAVSRR